MSTNYLMTNTITINPQLTAAAPTKSNSVIDSGQVSTLTSQPSGGTGSYTYVWYTIAGSTAPTCTAANTITGATVSTYTASPTSTNSYAYQVTDTASTNANACSSGATITVNPALSATIAPSSATNLDAGQTLIFSAVASAGTGPYTYNFLVFNSIGNTIIATQVGSSTTYPFVSNSNLVANTYYANVIVTDSATTPTKANSINSGIISVNSAPSLSISASNTLIDSGQSVTFMFTDTGGSGSHYTTELLNQTGSQSQVQSNVLITSVGGSNSITFTTSSPTQGNTFTYNALSTDQGTTLPYSFNSAKQSIAVNAIPTVSTFMQSNTALDTGQYDTYTLTLTSSTGTGPFTVNFVYTNNGVSANILTGVAIGGTATNTLKFTTAGTYTINAIVTDTGTTTAYVFNSATLSASVSSGVTGTSVVSTNAIVDQGQTEAITYTWSGGTPNYIANILVANTVASPANIIANSIT
ncbi:MAG: beta strand repeat-containing protein, partial [Gammaproteobacteria bacterium]